MTLRPDILDFIWRRYLRGAPGAYIALRRIGTPRWESLRWIWAARPPLRALRGRVL